MRVSCHPPRPRGLFPLHQATFRRAPRIFLFRNHLPRALKRGWLKKSADRGRMRPDNGRSAFDAICLHPHSYSQANRFHGAILAVHRIRIDLTSAPARTKEGAVDQSKIDVRPWKSSLFTQRPQDWLPGRCVPKEVLHTRARERLLEHFLSVVLRPGRMPPLTSQSDFVPFIRGPD